MLTPPLFFCLCNPFRDLPTPTCPTCGPGGLIAQDEGGDVDDPGFIAALVEFAEGVERRRGRVAA